MKLKYLLVILLVFSSCNSKNKKQTSFLPEPIIEEDSYVYYPIKDNRIEVNLNNPQKASLFDYFSHIELIPLETNKDVLIGSAREIILYQDRYFVFQYQNNRYLMAFVRLLNKDDGLLIYDKSSDECKYIEGFSESVVFLPRKLTNEYVLSWVSHDALEHYVSEEILDETNRQKFKNLMNEEAEMNPIIIKYYFK